MEAGLSAKGKSRFNVAAYLERLDYHGSLAVNAETLRALQLAHLLTVPFENLSIHAGEPIVLADDALFAKVIERKRGGFCYELNGLFAALLRALGFNVARLSAAVANAEGTLGPDFDHMTLLVTHDERWLVDVGFGDSFREPLLIDERTEQIQGADAYRISEAGEHLVLSQRGSDNTWKTQYQFTLQPYQYADYEEMCRYHQTSPESHFTKGRICTRATKEGRITLSEMRFITTTLKGTREERLLASEEEYAGTLMEQFGIALV